jgi:hypothetical protein
VDSCKEFGLLALLFKVGRFNKNWETEDKSKIDHTEARRVKGRIGYN